MNLLTVGDALQLFGPSSVEMLAGETGLNNVITGVTLIETPDVVNWVKAGEVLLTTGYIFKENPEELAALIRSLHEKNAAALGIKLKRYIMELPAAVPATANELSFPLFSIKEGSLSDIMARLYDRISQSGGHVAPGEDVEVKLKNDLVKRLLFGDFQAEKERIRQTADYLQIDKANEKAVFLVANTGKEITPGNSRQDPKKIFADVTGSDLVISNSSNELIGIIQAGKRLPAAKEAALQLAAALKKTLEKIFPQTGFALGISRFYQQLDDLHTCMLEARKALDIGSTVWPEKKIFHYSDIGFYRIIANQTQHDELETFYKDFLEPLVLHDGQYGAELVPTLEMFLELNGNNSLTAQKLFVHYNTVKYRLAQIEEILNVDLSSAEDRFNLQAALKIRKLLGK